jgi:ABC-type amino acid transport system permease subunit
VVLLIITYKFIGLFDSLKQNNPFCENNIKILKRTGIVSLIGSILWLIDFFYEIIVVKSDDIVFNATLIFLAVLFFGVSIALYILSELLKEATKYKKENELTI